MAKHWKQGHLCHHTTHLTQLLGILTPKLTTSALTPRHSTHTGRDPVTLNETSLGWSEINGPCSAAFSQCYPGNITHIDAVGDEITCWTVLWHSEFVRALREHGPVVIDVSKVDCHRGNREVVAD